MPSIFASVFSNKFTACTDIIKNRTFIFCTHLLFYNNKLFQDLQDFFFGSDTQEQKALISRKQGWQKCCNSSRSGTGVFAVSFVPCSPARTGSRKKFCFNRYNTGWKGSGSRAGYLRIFFPSFYSWQSYLTKTSYEIFPCTNAVPRGSVLSSILFLAYISDMSNFCETSAVKLIFRRWSRLI